MKSKEMTTEVLQIHFHYETLKIWSRTQEKKNYNEVFNLINIALTG